MPPRVPLVSLTASHAALAPQLAASFARVLDSSQFILGPEVSAFETEMASYLGVAHAVGVSSGTDALVCALAALGVGAGDEVITTPYSFVATAEAIVRVGATPKLVDVEARCLNLDAARVAEAFGDRTRAILPVHLFGHPADMSALLDVAAKHGVPIVEDAAQAIGAACELRRGVGQPEVFLDRPTIVEMPADDLAEALDRPTLPDAPRDMLDFDQTVRDGEPLDRPTLPSAAGIALGAASGPSLRRVGTLGALGCFSFFPSKPLGALGDGGLVVTHDAAMATRLRALRQHGGTAKHRYDHLGGNYRLDALQAALLRVKLPHLDTWLAARRAHAAAYEAELSDIPGLELPRTAPGSEPAWAHYVVRVKHGKRDPVARALAEQGIDTAVYYPTPLHLQPLFAGLGHRAGDFPVAEQAAAEALAIPLYPELSEHDRGRVVTALRAALG